MSSIVILNHVFYPFQNEQKRSFQMVFQNMSLGFGFHYGCACVVPICPIVCRDVSFLVVLKICV